MPKDREVTCFTDFFEFVRDFISYSAANPRFSVFSMIFFSSLVFSRSSFSKLSSFLLLSSTCKLYAASKILKGKCEIELLKQPEPHSDSRPTTSSVMGSHFREKRFIFSQVSCTTMSQSALERTAPWRIQR